jgi:hypothetical protein
LFVIDAHGGTAATTAKKTTTVTTTSGVVRQHEHEHADREVASWSFEAAAIQTVGSQSR